MKSRLQHLVISSAPETSLYSSTNVGGPSNKYPDRDRASHGQFLRNQFDKAWSESEQAVMHRGRSGLYLEFIYESGFNFEVTKLENIRSGVRLLNVRTAEAQHKEGGEPSQEKAVFATVYVPNNKKQHFANKIDKYLNENSSSGQPKNAPLINSLANIRKALQVESFWSDDIELIPKDSPEWVEVWLRSSDESILEGFDQLLSAREIPTKSGYLSFPERVVKAVYANHKQLEELTLSSDFIAEYRLAKVTASYWLESTNKEQAEWVENLLDRVDFDASTESAVCILDTGVNYGHPLIKPILQESDCHAVNSNWGTHDHDKHGTLMAGVAGYGNLVKHLESTDRIKINHHLESVKILPPPPEQNSANLWGDITSQAISLAEIQRPDRNRCICLAVTAEDTRDRGRPSSWSAQLDQLSSGADGSSNGKRLIVVSAGNITVDSKEAASKYPDIQLLDSVHDPAQSWNALTVGAYTEFDEILDSTASGYKTIAPKGGLSPFTTTSLTWEENKWPIKPELVMEGGNLAVDEMGFASEFDDLRVLSTYHDPQQAHFHHFGMTSAAAAQVAQLCGELQAHYPDFWPETVRGLLIHSAKWPEALKDQILQDDKKTSYKRLLSVCGYGCPDIDRATYSAENSLTLVAQGALQPYGKKASSSNLRTQDMHFYELPWPKDVLLSLPDDTEVEMRVTLSYFVEPGPGEVGWKDRYRYASHALRFDLNSPLESKDEFIRRINNEARNTDEGKPDTKSPSDHWLLGSQARDRGSVHSDIWQGTAAQLAASNLIAISPKIGWWRERKHLKKWDKKARYSLIVSIDTPDQSVDLYTPVAIQLNIPVEVSI